MASHVPIGTPMIAAPTPMIKAAPTGTPGTAPPPRLSEKRLSDMLSEDHYKDHYKESGTSGVLGVAHLDDQQAHFRGTSSTGASRAASPSPAWLRAAWTRAI